MSGGTESVRQQVTDEYNRLVKTLCHTDSRQRITPDPSPPPAPPPNPSPRPRSPSPEPAASRREHAVEHRDSDTQTTPEKPPAASGSVAERSFSLRDCTFILDDNGMQEFVKHLKGQQIIYFEPPNFPIIQEGENHMYKYHPPVAVTHNCWELYRCGITSYGGKLNTIFPGTATTVKPVIVTGTPTELLLAYKNQLDALTLFLASLVQLPTVLGTLFEHDTQKVRNTLTVPDISDAMSRFIDERISVAYEWENLARKDSFLAQTDAPVSFQKVAKGMFSAFTRMLTYERNNAAIVAQACMDHGDDLGEITATKLTIKTHADAMLAVNNGIIEFKDMSCLNAETQRGIRTTTGRIKPTQAMDTLMTILPPASFWAQDAFVSGTPSVLIKALKLHADVLAITIGTLDRVACAFEEAFNTGLPVSTACHKLLSSELDDRKLATLGTLGLPPDIQLKLTESRENTLNVAGNFIKRLEKASTEYNTLKAQANNLHAASVIDTQTGIVVETFLRFFVVRSVECVTKAIRDQDYTTHPLKRALDETLNALHVEPIKQGLIITKVPELNSVFLLEPPIRDGEEANRATQLVQKTARLQEIERRINALYDYIQSGTQWSDISGTDTCLQTLQSIIEAYKTTKERHETLERGLDDLKAKMEGYDTRTAQQAPTNTKLNTVWETYTRQIDQSRRETRDAEANLAEAKREAERETAKHSQEIKTLREEIQNITGQLARKDSEHSRERKDAIAIKDDRIHRLEYKLSETIEERDLLKDEYDALDSRKNTFQANLQTITIEKERLLTELAEIQTNEQKLNTEIDQGSQAFAMNTMLPQAPSGEVLCPARQKLFQLFEDMSRARQNKPAHGPPQQVPGVLLHENPGLRQKIARCVARLFAHVTQAVHQQNVLTLDDIERVENEFYETDEEDTLRPEVPEAHRTFLRIYNGYCDIDVQHLAREHASKILNKVIIPSPPIQHVLNYILSKHIIAFFQTCQGVNNNNPKKRPFGIEVEQIRDLVNTYKEQQNTGLLKPILQCIQPLVDDNMEHAKLLKRDAIASVQNADSDASTAKQATPSSRAEGGGASEHAESVHPAAPKPDQPAGAVPKPDQPAGAVPKPDQPAGTAKGKEGGAAGGKAGGAAKGKERGAAKGKEGGAAPKPDQPAGAAKGKEGGAAGGKAGPTADQEEDQSQNRIVDAQASWNGGWVSVKQYIHELSTALQHITARRSSALTMELFVVFSFLQRDLLDVRSNERYVISTVDDHMRAHLSSNGQATPPHAGETANCESEFVCERRAVHCLNTLISMLHTGIRALHSQTIETDRNRAYYTNGIPTRVAIMTFTQGPLPPLLPPSEPP